MKCPGYTQLNKHAKDNTIIRGTAKLLQTERQRIKFLILRKLHTVCELKQTGIKTNTLKFETRIQRNVLVKRTDRNEHRTMHVTKFGKHFPCSHKR